MNSDGYIDQLIDGTTIFYGTKNGKEVVIDGEHIPYRNSVFCPNGKTVMEIKEYLAKKHGIEDVTYVGLKLEVIYPYYNDDGTIKNADGSLDITNAKGGVELRSCAQDFLELENQFLRDELELQEIENSLELIQTIKDCIRKEGGVSSSLEIMFGENWSDKSVALEELEKSEEGIIKSVFDKALHSVKLKAILVMMNKRMDELDSLLKTKNPSEKIELTINYHAFIDVFKHAFMKLDDIGNLFSEGKNEEACKAFEDAVSLFNSDDFKSKARAQGGSLTSTVTYDELCGFIQKMRKDFSEDVFNKLNSQKETVKKFIETNSELAKKHNMTPITIDRVYGSFTRILTMGWSRIVQQVIEKVKTK